MTMTLLIIAVPVLAPQQVEYEKLPGWKSDISKARTWNELPQVRAL